MARLQRASRCTARRASSMVPYAVSVSIDDRSLASRSVRISSGVSRSRSMRSRSPSGRLLVVKFVQSMEIGRAYAVREWSDRRANLLSK